MLQAHQEEQAEALHAALWRGGGGKREEGRGKGDKGRVVGER